MYSNDVHLPNVIHNASMNGPMQAAAPNFSMSSLPNKGGSFGQYNPMNVNLQFKQPMTKFLGGSPAKSHPLKHFKQQDLEMQYMEKKLKPEVEKEIKEGFFEIKKKFNDPSADLVRQSGYGEEDQES